MAQPHQYHGLRWGAPVWPGEGTDEYRESYRPQPFNAAGTGDITADQTFIPGRQNEVTRTFLLLSLVARLVLALALPLPVPVSKFYFLCYTKSVLTC